MQRSAHNMFLMTRKFGWMGKRKVPLRNVGSAISSHPGCAKFPGGGLLHQSRWVSNGILEPSDRAFTMVSLSSHRPYVTSVTFGYWVIVGGVFLS